MEYVSSKRPKRFKLCRIIEKKNLHINKVSLYIYIHTYVGNWRCAKSANIPTDPACLCAIASYFPSISSVFCSTRSWHFEAVRLQGHRHRIFPEALHQTKKEHKHENAAVPDSSPRAQKFLSENLRWSGSPKRLVSYYSCKKQRIFLPRRGSPPTSDVLPNACSNFPCRMPTCR